MSSRAAGGPATPAAEPTPADLDELARELDASFAAVRGDAVALDTDADIGGVPVRLRFGSEGLAAEMAPAFLAPEAGSPEPEFTISIWANEVPDLIAYWQKRVDTLLPGSTGAQVVAAGHTLATDPVSGALTLVDAAAGRAWFTVGGEDTLAWWERGSPVRIALTRLVNRPGARFMHTAGVAHGESGALITGRGGIGKSTLALACVEAGLDYVGEDYVMLRPGRPPTARLIYTTAKLDDRSLGLLPGLADAVSHPAGDGADKAILRLGEARPDALRRSAPVTAIVVPQIDPATSEPVLERVPPAQGVLALAPTSTLHAFDPEGGALALAAEVARSVPTFTLRMGRDPAAAAAAVADLLGA